MRCLRHLSFIAAFVVVSVNSVVLAADIQMLPPVNFDGTNKTPCASGTTAGLLYWDGATAIKCIPGSSGDSSGNLRANGSVQVGNDGNGTPYCAPQEAGKIRFNTGTKVFEGCDGAVWGSLFGGKPCDGSTFGLGQMSDKQVFVTGSCATYGFSPPIQIYQCLNGGLQLVGSFMAACQTYDVGSP